MAEEATPRVVWRYTSPTAQAKHAIDLLTGGHTMSPGHAARAVCGTELWRPEDWMGSGTQAEAERLEQLPRCKRCLSAMGL